MSDSTWSIPFLFPLTLSLSIPSSLALVFAENGSFLTVAAVFIWVVLLLSSQLVSVLRALPSVVYYGSALYFPLTLVSWVVYCIYFFAKHQKLPAFNRDTLNRLLLLSIVLAVLFLAASFWVTTVCIFLFFLPIALVQQESAFYEHSSQTCLIDDARKASRFIKRTTLWGLFIFVASFLLVIGEAFLLMPPQENPINP